MIKIVSTLALFYSLASGAFLISAGGYDVYKHKKHYSFTTGEGKGKLVNITKVLRKYSKNTNSVAIWITKDWEEDWYSVKSMQRKIIDKGYVPQFIFYWFADEINPKYVQENKKAYFKTLKKFLTYLQKLDGQKIVVLNPEYNMDGTESWEPMNELFLKSYRILREDPQVIVGPCVGDFGNYRYVNEPEEWKLFDKSLYRAAKEADFIAFQEMRALTRNSKKDILRTATRAYHFSKYLHKKYKKPTLLSYVAISSYGRDGEMIQADVYRGFVKYLPLMKKESKLLLFGTFHYFDYPGHVGYFKEAEEFFGLLNKDGKKKPAFREYNRLH